MAAGTQIGNVLFTDIGGVATRMVAEENLNAGELVSAGTVNGKVVKTATSGKTTLGVVFENALANADVWVVTSGIANILPEAGVTATRGQVAFSSASTAGRAAQSATDASRKVGVFIASGTGAGVLTQAVLQLVGVDAASIGAGTTAFTWSTTEQVWPFEKFDDGSTLYAKQIEIAALPNAAGWHAVGTLGTSDCNNIFRLEGRYGQSTSTYDMIAMDNAQPQSPTTVVGVRFYNGNVELNVAIDFSSYYGEVRAIYKK